MAATAEGFAEHQRTEFCAILEALTAPLDDAQTAELVGDFSSPDDLKRQHEVAEFCKRSAFSVDLCNRSERLIFNTVRPFLLDFSLGASFAEGR